MGSCTFKAIYFGTVTVWGYMVLKDQYYMPVSMGGTGDFRRTHDEFPYAQHLQGLKEYILIPMGYHLGSLVMHFVGPRKNDFVEMGLHHLVALYLFGGCYLTNIWEIGAVIAFVHDVADMPT